MIDGSSQGELFGNEAPLPEGFAYRPDFISTDEETALVEAIAALPLRPARYKTYEARRRILSFGFSYDFSANRLEPAPPIPAFLLALRQRAAAWLALDARDFEHALLTEYLPGTPIGWHRDSPDFETVVGVSLAGRCRMRFRPYPHLPRGGHPGVDIELAPRSAYVLRHAARWRWQHHIPPAAEHRYSITFRTLRGGHARGDSSSREATI
jgi:alkylated DNA repair dioxygenase AlkB